MASRKTVVRAVGITLMGFGAVLGLVAAGYVLYGPNYAAGTLLPIAPSPVVLWAFWSGVVFLSMGIAVTLVEELAMTEKETEVERPVEAERPKLAEPIQG